MINNRSKYKPYPSYKPTGTEWLGEIPEGCGIGKRFGLVISKL
ncbi:MAG: hypothetical protein OZ917_01230 [Candidatus Brocadiaceae bacterium]|nr:hypothetical protein [Candidatus Brocadiaceae bacterium]